MPSVPAAIALFVLILVVMVSFSILLIIATYAIGDYGFKGAVLRLFRLHKTR